MKALGVVALALLLAGCDPCAGTPSCTVEPEVSYTGQFIEFPSGRSVAKVAVRFVRTGGVSLVTDTIQSVSDGDGFFVLRAGALGDGMAEGALVVVPPAPHRAYTVGNVRLATHRKRGDGGVLGRLMVNPYLQFIGELHDRKTNAVVPGASIIIRQFGPAVVEPAVSQTASAENGRFMWEPTVVEFGKLDVEFEVSASGYPRSYRIRDTIELQYRDEPPRLVALLVGGGWSYRGVLLRRGTYQPVPGVVVDFVRTTGISATPDSFTIAPDAGGSFPFPLEPIGDGTLVGELRIRPPGGLRPDTLRGVRLATFDGGKTTLLPFFYGPGAIARPVLLYRSTGHPVKTGTHVRFTHVGGLTDLFPAPWGVPVDSGIRIVDSTGTVGYDAATVDTGIVRYDLEVRLNEPHEWETLRSVAVPARRSDTPAVDTFRVGSWLPWIGSLRDAGTNAPIAGANVRFLWAGGTLVRPLIFSVVSRADGTFPISPVPRGKGSVNAVLSITTGGAYRDTSVQIRIQPTQDDTVRAIPVIRLTRIP